MAFISTDSSRLFLDLAPDWRVFAFIASLAVLACLFFGLSPALKATGTNPGKTMQAGGRSSTDSHERFALRRGLVVVQVALSMVLIVGAILFGRSLRNLTTVDPGFRTDGILAVNVDLRRSAVDPAGPHAGVHRNRGSVARGQRRPVRRRSLHGADERIRLESERHGRRRAEGRERQLQPRGERFLQADGHPPAGGAPVRSGGPRSAPPRP